jgi:hypothetical protein
MAVTSSSLQEMSQPQAFFDLLGDITPEFSGRPPTP